MRNLLHKLVDAHTAPGSKTQDSDEGLLVSSLLVLCHTVGSSNGIGIHVRSNIDGLGKITLMALALIVWPC